MACDLWAFQPSRASSASKACIVLQGGDTLVPISVLKLRNFLDGSFLSPARYLVRSGVTMTAVRALAVERTVYSDASVRAAQYPQTLGIYMPLYPDDEAVVSQIETLRIALPAWVISTVELVELAENAERAARDTNPQTADRSRKLIVEIAEWQQKLSDWQMLSLSPRLLAELRILKATLDASMDEANAAAAELKLFD